MRDADRVLQSLITGGSCTVEVPLRASDAFVAPIVSLDDIQTGLNMANEAQQPPEMTSSPGTGRQTSRMRL